MTRLPVLAAPPPDTTSGPDRAALARDLSRAVEGEVRFDLHNRMLYSTDASLYQVEPLGVVIPASVEDALRAVEFCAARGLPILPRGGGTSLAGQCVNRAVVIDFSAHCRAIRAIDAKARTCDVEPGITVDDLNDTLARQGLFFAPDPATTRQCNIGGCLGNNAAGARSILYGRTSENLAAIDAAILGAEGSPVRRVRLERGSADPFVRGLALRVAEVVQRNADRIRERFPRTIRRNAGYGMDLILQQMDRAGPRADSDQILDQLDLAQLLCGSEGTLAVTLGATLKLRPLPKGKGLAVIGLPSLDEAVGLVGAILRTNPSAVELLDDTIIDLASANTEYRRYVELMPAPARGPLRAVLYVEYFSDTGPEEIRERFEGLRALLGVSAPDSSIACYSDARAMLSAWKLRKAGEPLLHGTPGDRKPLTFVEDNAVPVENLGQFVREFRRVVENHGTRAAFWAHASVGVLHVRPFLDIRDEADRQRMQEIAVQVADLARALGGVMSGEHGDGRVRGPLLERFFGPELMGAFGEIKAIFDPRNLLNPGNIVSPGPVASIVESIRVKPAAVFVDVPAVSTYYDYDDQHGFRGAVEMCNGAGVCRKTSGGTMCPSYMGTLDERHATRGRGNALRLAITGQLTPGSGPAWNDPATRETLDLCLSCKACKSECPSNVDIARLKAEYTAQGYREAGHIPLKARVFGNVRLLNRIGSVAPGIANWFNRQGPVRWLLGEALGMSPRRTVPAFARSLKRQWGLSRGAGAGAPVVALFADCFTMYNEPQIGLAARRVLESFGYRVELVDAGCCGRAMMSTGLLADAIQTADDTLRKFERYIRDPGVAAVLVCEPSCLSAFKDDWLTLKLRSPLKMRKLLAGKSWLVEEFLEREWDRHPVRPEVRSGSGPVVLHGHCHQKALWGAESSAALVRRLVGDRLRVLDTGCCGMAGSFGYTKDHYDLSMRIGELSLFPAVRAAREQENATFVAPGTSCRHQIKDGEDVCAVHPIQLVASVLGVDDAAY